MRFDLSSLAESPHEFEFEFMRGNVLAEIEEDLLLPFCVAAVAKQLTLDELAGALADKSIAVRTLGSNVFQGVFTEIRSGHFALPDRYKAALSRSVNPSLLRQAHEKWFQYFLRGGSDLAQVEAIFHGAFASPEETLFLAVKTIDFWEQEGRVEYVDRLAEPFSSLDREALPSISRLTAMYVSAKSQSVQRLFSDAALLFRTLSEDPNLPLTLRGFTVLAAAEALEAGGYHESALNSYFEAIKLLQSAGGSRDRLRALLGAGEVAQREGWLISRELFQDAMDVAIELGDRSAEAQALLGLGSSISMDERERVKYLDLALQAFQSQNDEVRVARAHLLRAGAGWSEPVESTLMHLTEAVLRFNELGWDSAISEAVKVLERLLNRRGDQRSHLIQLLMRSRDPLMVSVGVRSIAAQVDANQGPLSGPERCFRSFQSLLEIYCGRRLSDDRVWYNVYEFQDALASIRSNESELMVLFRTLRRNNNYDISDEGHALMLESLCLEGLRLGNRDISVEYLSELSSYDNERGAVVRSLLDVHLDTSLNLSVHELDLAQAGEDLFAIAFRLKAHGCVLEARGSHRDAMEAYMRAILGFVEREDYAQETQTWQFYESAARKSGDGDGVETARKRLEMLSRAFKLRAGDPLLAPAY